jgi:hypothetical protein
MGLIFACSVLNRKLMHLVHIFRVQAGTDVDLHNGKNGSKIL